MPQAVGKACGSGQDGPKTSDEGPGFAEKVGSRIPYRVQPKNRSLGTATYSMLLGICNALCKLKAALYRRRYIALLHSQCMSKAVQLTHGAADTSGILSTIPSCPLGYLWCGKLEAHRLGESLPPRFGSLPTSPVTHIPLGNPSSSSMTQGYSLPWCWSDPAHAAEDATAHSHRKASFAKIVTPAGTMMMIQFGL